MGEAMKKVCIIVGSLRKDSFNFQLAKKVEELISSKAEVFFLDYKNVPLMNQDIEFPAPESISEVRKQVQQADAIWICSPEYNCTIPGVLKNLLDWLSRPLKANDFSSGTAVMGKKVTICGAGGKFATAGMRKNLKELLEFIKMQVIYSEGTGIAVNPDAFATNKVVFTQEQLDLLSKQAEQLLSEI